MSATVAIVGTGLVGRAIGSALAAVGYDAVYGSRTPGEGTVDITRAVASGEVIVVATPPEAARDFARDQGGALAGKLVIDATNDVMATPANAAAAFAEHAPKCRYARAFNSLGVEILADPLFDGEPADMYYSCASADQPQLDDIVTALGLRPVYVGEQGYDLVDGVMRLWLTLAMGRGLGRNLAFRLVTR